MEASEQVWHGLVDQIKAIAPRMHGHQVKTWAWWVLGALRSQSLCPPVVAEALMEVQRAQVPSIERRLRRFLANPRVPVAAVWAALLPVLLRWWCAQGSPVVLVLDATLLEERAVVLYLGLWVHGRVLPLAWHVEPGQTRWRERQWSVVARLFAQVQPSLRGCRVTVLADRGFAGHPLVALAQEQGWHYVLRLEGTHCCQRLPTTTSGALAASPALPWQPVAQVVTRPGQRWAGAVRLWKKRGMKAGYRRAPVAGCLSVCWAVGAAAPWCLFSDQPAGPARCAEYARRFAVEATFQEAKSRGWDLEAVGVQGVERLNVLLLVLALTLWWDAHLAASCLHHGQRRQFDRADRRDKGILRLGHLYFRWRLTHPAPRPVATCLPFRLTPSGWCLPLRF